MLLATGMRNRVLDTRHFFIRYDFARRICFFVYWYSTTPRAENECAALLLFCPHSLPTFSPDIRGGNNLGYVASLCYVDMWIHSHQILTRHRNIIHSDYLVAVVYTHRPARSSIFYALLLVELGNTPQEER